MDIPIWQVVAMGMGTVFVVLVCLIIISIITSAIIKAFSKKEKESAVPAKAASVTTAPPAVAALPVNKQALVAAIGVCIAEDMGTDISRLRIHSIKPIGKAENASAGQGVVAAIGACIAEDMGTDVKRLRIHSIKKIG